MMNNHTERTRTSRQIGASVCIVFCLGLAWRSSHPVTAQGGRNGYPDGPVASFSQILGRPTDTSITLSLLSGADTDVVIEVGAEPGKMSRKLPKRSLKANQPEEVEIDGLKPNTRYYYRVSKKTLTGEPTTGGENSFTTRRSQGASFTFAVQGDSHPERQGKMYSPELYAITMRNAQKQSPDFYFLLGDDFSIERLIERNALSQSNVDAVYSHQRGFLGMVGATTPLMLVNGNHEQAALHWLDGTETNPGVLAARARARFFPLPAPNGFYTGNTENVKPIGLLRDYYAWHWGDALFVVIDPYWHSSVGVDDGRTGKEVAPSLLARETEPCCETPQEPAQKQGRKKGQGGGKGGRDMWKITLGEAQYRWLHKTLLESKAKYKFVFAHHVLGTGRGGVEEAGLYEWGGKDRNGSKAFAAKRPGWEMPIHDLFVKSGVTIFFQGHDHIYARQELDGVVYQSTPNPADNTYQAFNREAYRSGTVLPNAGHLRVNVGPEQVKVEYVRSFLPKDEQNDQKNGMVAHSYTVKSTVK